MNGTKQAIRRPATLTREAKRMGMSITTRMATLTFSLTPISTRRSRRSSLAGADAATADFSFGSGFSVRGFFSVRVVGGAGATARFDGLLWAELPVARSLCDSVLARISTTALHWMHLARFPSASSRKRSKAPQSPQRTTIGIISPQDSSFPIERPCHRLLPAAVQLLTMVGRHGG